MLTDNDIKKLTDIFATREELLELFPTKNEFEELRQDFRDLQSAVDAYAHKADVYFQEMVVLTHKVDRLEKWIHQIAEKAGIKLEY